VAGDSGAVVQCWRGSVRWQVAGGSDASLLWQVAVGEWTDDSR
jgi:hypothetical protein